MNRIMNVKGIECFEKDGMAYLKLETVARGLGFTRDKNGTEYIMWDRVRKYIDEIGFHTSVENELGVATSCDGKSVPTSGDGEKLPDFIPENIFYRLAMKAKNEAAERFQALVADEIIPSIRKTGGYITRETSEQIRLEAQKARADAMLLNAKNRAFRTLMSAVEKKNLSPIAVQVFGLKGIEGVFGVDTGNYLPQVEKTYTATEVGKMFGISAHKVGMIANANGLKTDEYGITVMDKSRHSPKMLPSFRYNQKAVEKFRGILKGN